MILRPLRAVALSFAFALPFVAAMAGPAHADKPAVFVERFQNVAAGGYDLTSFFAGTPVRGSRWRKCSGTLTKYTNR